MLSISATVWQNWAQVCAGTWRTDPHTAGGGFLFDTGAHMLNTVSDLAGEPFVEVSAWLAQRGQPVETVGVAMARLASGALVTLHGCGDTIPACTSEVLVFCTEAILRTGVWGGALDIQRRGEPELTPAARAPLARGVGAVPRGAARGDAQPIPAGGWPAHGQAVGCHPGLRRAGRRARPAPRAGSCRVRRSNLRMQGGRRSHDPR